MVFNSVQLKEAVDDVLHFNEHGSWPDGEGLPVWGFQLATSLGEGQHDLSKVVLLLYAKRARAVIQLYEKAYQSSPDSKQVIRLG